MKAASIKELKTELSTRSARDLQEYCLRLARFKKDNKELLTYLLFESFDEAAFIRSLKQEVDESFRQINKTSYYYIKKSSRKILSVLKKNIRYSQKKETELDLLIYFCKKLNEFTPDIHRNFTLHKLYNRQLELIIKTYNGLHEDLQMDYEEELEELSAHN